MTVKTWPMSTPILLAKRTTKSSLSKIMVGIDTGFKITLALQNEGQKRLHELAITDILTYLVQIGKSCKNNQIFCKCQRLSCRFFLYPQCYESGISTFK